MALRRPCLALVRGLGLHSLSTLTQEGYIGPHHSSEAQCYRRARQEVQVGQYRKAIQVLPSSGLASPSPDVLQEMLTKHPQSPPPSLPTDPVPPPMVLSESIVSRSVRSFPRGSASGPSGFRVSHLREAVLCPSPSLASQTISILTKFVNLLVKGCTPPSVTPHLCGASLLACHKKNGGLRSIAVGEVLRRLTSKCLSCAVRSAAFAHLAPLQLGVNVKGGCEAVIHSVSHLMSSGQPDQQWVLLLDFTNAFNTINRFSMFEEFRAHIPGLSAWMESCYSGQPFLHLGSQTILSCCGVQQGDPLGPLGFALTLHPIVERIRAAVPNLTLNAWYLDDGILVGSSRDIAAALNIIESDGPPVGLNLNRAVSLLFIPEDADASCSPLPPEISITQRGFTLLGCPIGPASFCEEVFLSRVAKVKTSLGFLQDMDDSQLETALLRSCLAFPKVVFPLRTCPPHYIHHALEEFDNGIRESLEAILAGTVPTWSWLKVSLPSCRGGLGLRSSTLHAPAAFLGSRTQAESLMERILGHPPGPSPHTQLTLAALASATARPDWTSLDEVDVPLHQKPLSLAIEQKLLSSAPDT